MSDKYQIIELPNGEEVEFPIDMSDEQNAAVLMNGNQTFTSPHTDPTEGMSGVDKYLAGVGKSFVDTYRGGKQLLGIGDQEALQQEIDLAKERDEPLMSTGAGIAGNLTGGIVSFLPTMAIPGANTYAGATLLGSGIGALTPTATGESRGLNMATGGVGGFGGRGVAGGISRVLAPKTAPAVTGMINDGVKLTPGQILGGITKSLEDKAMSLPLVGDMISAARRKSLNTFNTSILNKVVSSIDEKVGKIGHEGIEEAGEKISQAYTKALKGVAVKADDQFLDEIVKLSEMTKMGGDNISKQFDEIINQQIFARITPAGRMSGETMKTIDSELGSLARGYKGSQNFSERQLGDAILEIKYALMKAVERSAPGKKTELQAINTAYAKLMRVERAASNVGTDSGIFTPAQLKSASKAMDRSLNKRDTARGNALFQNEAQLAKNIIPSNIPDSGTAGRLMPYAMGGATYAEPTVVLPLMGMGAAAYTNPMQRLMQSSLTQRPEFIRQLGEGVGRAGTLSGLLGTNAALRSGDAVSALPNLLDQN